MDEIETRADAFLARHEAIRNKTERSFAPHEAILDEAEKNLTDVEEALRLLSNDPLPASGE